MIFCCASRVTYFFYRLENLFQRVPLDLDDEVYIYKIEAIDNMSYQLYEAYKIIDQGYPIIRQVGSWSKEAKSLRFVKEDKNARRGDLRVSANF